MKTVLDTNVIVSGLLKPFSPPGEIVRILSSGGLELCYDARIISEYEAVLKCAKFRFEQIYITDLLDQIKAYGHVVAAKPLTGKLPDTDDEPFLEVALAGNAQYLITGNLRHYPPKKRQGMPVVSPAKFLDAFKNSLR